MTETLCKHELTIYATDDGPKGCAFCYPPSAEDIALVDALVAEELRDDEKRAAREEARETRFVPAYVPFDETPEGRPL